MKRIFKLFVVLLLLSSIWVLFFNDEEKSIESYSLEQVKLKLDSLKDHPNVVAVFDTLESGMDSLLNEIQQVLDTDSKEIDEARKEMDKPNLDSPLSHSFSIHNIEIGDTRKDVESLAGSARRSSFNEYGVDWFAYHDDYHNFFMAAYNDEGQVSALYTNQDLLTSKQGIKIGSPMEYVLEQLGSPSTSIQKGFISYQIENNDEYHLFELDDSYVTVFYDKHENNTVTAIQIISNELEHKKSGYYSVESSELKEGFEYQLFDLTNAVRVEHGLPTLSWDEAVKETARAHSLDMAENQYFSHTNLDGQSPFDRMIEDHISFRTAGENLAAGQVSSIFAHEGLMNSKGHRENILQKEFEALGVGVAFDSESRPYYTENFLAN